MSKNAIMTSKAPFSLTELSRLIEQAGCQPVGFVVSQKIYDGFKAEIQPANPAWVFGGVRVVMDPKMPETEFEAVFAHKAWRRRMREIHDAR